MSERDDHRRCSGKLGPLFLVAACTWWLAGCDGTSGDALVIAHRGASEDAPENTLAAFELAWQRGADGIEGDFYLTADEQIVCIHDMDTARTAGAKLPVADSTLAELRELDVGAWKDGRWAGQRIPTLAEVLATVPEGRRIYLEIKCGPVILDRMGPIIAASGLADEQIVIISFSEDVIDEAGRTLPRFKRLWLTGFEEDEATGSWRPTAGEAVTTLGRIGADGLSCKAHDCVDEAFVAAIRAAGCEFHVWTVNGAAAARRFAGLGVDSITTDRPRWLRRQLGRSAYRSGPENP
jgi:glycerophosphoryl diester phosphodiesterase